jgi:hypothetical protein
MNDRDPISSLSHLLALRSHDRHADSDCSV